MSTELTPFAEVTQPTAAADGIDGSANGPYLTLGRLTLTTSWLASRLPAAGRLRQPRSVIIADNGDGSDGDLDDSATAAELAESLGVGLQRVDLTSTAAQSPVADDVLTRAEAVAAIDAGRHLADAEIDGGTDLFIPGLAGHGHVVPLGVLTAVLTGLEPVSAIPLPDTDFDRWTSGVTDLRDALFRIREHDKDAVSLISAVGGPALGTLAGLLAQAAVRRTPVLLDGLPATVAAVLAHRLAPGAEGWFLAAGEAVGRAGRRLQDMLGLPTVAALETDSPSGVGGLLVFPLIQAALLATPSAAAEVPAAETPEAPEPVSLTKD